MLLPHKPSREQQLRQMRPAPQIPPSATSLLQSSGGGGGDGDGGGGEGEGGEGEGGGGEGGGAATADARS